MKISYNWLKDYVDFKKTPTQLAEDLSLFGQEVESIKKLDDDTILDLEITPNRGDCLSILGMAREISALYNIPLKQSSFSELSRIEESAKIDKKIEVKVSGPEICPRFSARIIDNIKINPSPDWLKKRLQSYGFRSINNVVDVTNFVMVATGQPLHAFDYNKIKDGNFTIRLSKKDEEVITLDSVNRKLCEGIIIIEDDEKIYDLAGIMGGFKSEVDEKTSTIVLTAAIFDPILIRRASKFLNHTTDSSYRYERGVDYEGNLYGLNLAAQLIKELIPDAKASELIDQKNQPFKEQNISYDPVKINRLLGTKLTSEEIAANLIRLNFRIKDSTARVPSYRLFDVKIWQDLAEEVARIYGYNNLDKNNLDKQVAPRNKEFSGTEKIKDELAVLGFTETLSYSFIDKNKLEILNLKASKQPQIEKSLLSEIEYLRPNLLSSLLSVITKNPWAPEVKIFEMEAVFEKDTEKWQLGIATTGKSDDLLKSALKKLNINSMIKNVDQKILDYFKIRRPVKHIIVDIDNIELPTGDYSLKISRTKYKPISKFPPTVRDLAFLVDVNVSSVELIDKITRTDEHILLVELFDEFSSNKFGPNKKNVAFHIWLQDLKNVLSENKVTDIIAKIIVMMNSQYRAKLRSK
ncbi:MAG: phenylalanine--tRNA ligase subunit beta [Patescibacteria group bacterium]|jgi:phenylalanyl-tRNA synthetase beta chain